MRMTNKTKLFGAVAVAGIVAATGSAFTAGGSTVSGASQFIGGTVSQSVTGAHVTTVAYTEGSTDAGTNVYQKSVKLTFGESHPAGSVTVKVDGAGSAITCDGFSDPATDTVYTCSLDGGTGAGVPVTSLAITATA